MSKRRRETYLYHYTTAEGLTGIVRDKKIWATNVFYLNNWVVCRRRELAKSCTAQEHRFLTADCELSHQKQEKM